jgi:hypothetical protein
MDHLLSGVSSHSKGESFSSQEKSEEKAQLIAIVPVPASTYWAAGVQSTDFSRPTSYVPNCEQPTKVGTLNARFEGYPKEHE